MKYPNEKVCYTEKKFLLKLVYLLLYKEIEFKVTRRLLEGASNYDFEITSEYIKDDDIYIFRLRRKEE